MDLQTFTARAEQLAADELEVRIHAESRPHPFVSGRRAFVDPPLTLYHGSFREAADAEPGYDFEEALAGAVRLAGERAREDREAAEAVRDDEALFEAHARFRRGLPLPDGWYRRGEALAAGVWVVDLDVFVDVWLRTSEWEALRGGRLEIRVLDDAFEIELAADAVLDEVWTLPNCGLFEPAPGVDETELEETDEDALPGRFGDLHVIPYAF